METDIGDIPVDPPEAPIDGGVDVGDLPEAPIDGGVDVGDLPEAPIDGGVDIEDTSAGEIDSEIITAENGDVPVPQTEMYALSETPTDTTGDVPQITEQGDLVDGSAGDDAEEAMVETPGSDVEQGRTIEARTYETIELPALRADDQAPPGGNGGDNGGNGKKKGGALSAEDEAFLKDIEQMREKRQQEMKDDAAALKDKFGPLDVDGAATTLTDEERLIKRVQDLKIEKTASEAAELAELKSKQAQSGLEAADAIPATPTHKPPDISDGKASIHPTTPGHPEKEPSPEGEPVTIKAGNKTPEGSKTPEGNKTPQEWRPGGEGKG